MNELSGKIALVTGATSGIGNATVNRFVTAGARVIAVGRNKEKLDAMMDEGGLMGTLAMDVTNESDVEMIFDYVEEIGSKLDVLVNAAGTIASGTIETTTIEAWDAMFGVNLRAVFMLMQAAVPFLEIDNGNIVNVSSVTGLRAFPGVLAYCVSKAGLDQLTRCAALELASKGIRVNAVNPGVVITDIHKRGGMDEEAYGRFLEHSKGTHPLGRVGKAEEIAELILFLASEKASWITGATYSIDGGRAQTCAR